MILILSIIAASTSALSAVAGMGGGILLLSAMTFFMSFQVIVPVHGVVQMVSNGSRSFLLRKNIIWPVIGWFAVGLPVGVLISVYLLKSMRGEYWPKYLVAALILYVVFKPKKWPQLKFPIYCFAMVGFLSGVMGLMVGATGPLIAPFFVRDDFSKENIVATKAAVQIMGHTLKIPAFLYLSFDYSEHLAMIVCLSVAAICGTRFGINLLKNMSTIIFRRLFKLALLFAALRILLLGLSG